MPTGEGAHGPSCAILSRRRAAGPPPDTREAKKTRRRNGARRRAPTGRRAVLAAGLVALLTSCDIGRPTGGPSAPPPPDPDEPPAEAGRSLDEAREVVIADVFGACDAAHRFVVAAPGIVHSEVYDPTPEEKHAYETPVPTLVASVVTLEEIGASSAQEVTVR